MNTRKFINVLSFLLFILLIYESSRAGPESSSKLYALSVSKLETIVLDWLYQSGFETRRTQLDRGDVLLTVTRPAEQWQLVLKPHSASSTEIRASSETNALRRDTAMEQLAAKIAKHIQGAADKKEVSNQVIPPAILSQVGSVVCLNTQSDKKNSQHTGFVVDPQGLVLTTIHDVETFDDITVTLYDGRELAGDVIKKNTDEDLALINIRAGLENIVSLAKGRNLLGMGERIYSVGCPINLVGSVFPGIINGPPRRVNKLTYWQVNMEIHPGSSGSPVFDVQGNLVGIVKGRYRGTQSIGFLIPLETIIAFVKEPN